MIPVFFQMDPRVALVFWIALLLLAGGGIAWEWTRLLPPERSPFASPGEPRPPFHRDNFAAVVLPLLTLSFLAKLPGFPQELLHRWLLDALPEPWPDRVIAIVSAMLVLAAGTAAAYGIIKINPLRLSMIFAGAGLLLLWVFEPSLLASFAASR